MFDRSLPEVGDLAALDDAALVDAAGGWARTENAACARKLAVMAELFARRTGLPAGEREDWWVDPEAAVGAELGATQHISAWMALAQAHRGMVLADRLPKIAALFAAGLISEMVVRAIEYRTALVTDNGAIARVDELLAEKVLAWGPLSVRKTEQAIDAIVDQLDPGALRRSRKATCDRDVQFGSPSDEAGFTSMWARLYAPDAVVLEQRVEEMARSVCEDDPRTPGERRSEALAAVAAGLHELACQCDSTECPAAQRDATPPATAVIHVVADTTTVEAAQAGNTAGTPPPSRTSPAKPDVDGAPVSDDALVPPAFCPAPAAFVIGGGVMPAPLLAATLERATVREICHPGDAPPEPHYRPSRALADFVRCRDLTCRWPGCDKPAYDCDIDHTVPWPVGPTHASNIKCYCRFHRIHSRYEEATAKRCQSSGTHLSLMSTAVVEAEWPDFKSQPPDLSLSGHRMPGMSIAGIWIASAFGLAFFGFAIAGVARWRESRRPIAAQYHRMVPRLRRPLVFRERGLRNYYEELFRSEESG